MGDPLFNAGHKERQGLKALFGPLWPVVFLECAGTANAPCVGQELQEQSRTEGLSIAIAKEYMGSWSRAEEHPSYAWVILGLITGTHVMNIYSGRSIVPLTPLLQADLNLTHFQIGMFTSVYFMGAFFFSIPMGWLVDRIGVFWTMPLGQIIVGCFILFLSLADSFVSICILLFLAGIGHAAINPATAKVVMAWFPLKRRAIAMGVKQTGVPIGGALGAATLPALGLWLGWRIAFGVAGFVSIVSVALCLLYYRRPAKSSQSAVPLISTTYRLGEVLKNRDLMLLSVLTIAFLMLQSSLETYIVLYCHDFLFYSIIASGYLLSITHIGAVAGRLSWGPISDLLWGAKRKVVLMLIGGLSSIMCLAFALLSQEVPVWILGGLALVFGACAIGWNGMYLIFAAELAGRGREGRALGLSLTIAFVGHLVGPPLFGYIVDSSGTYSKAWATFCVIMAATTVLIGLVREPEK